MVSFTGSTRAGKRVSEVGAQTVKRIALELGGKSASIVLDDADFEKAIKGSVSNCYMNSGQTCAAWTRLLVPRARLDEARAIAKATAESFTVGSAFADGVRLGPLVSAVQRPPRAPPLSRRRSGPFPRAATLPSKCSASAMQWLPRARPRPTRRRPQ
jgi:acyl-CoA reductase-like NAD-dependent aldehyde dehydrogenase